jgi:hypothetical protein
MSQLRVIANIVPSLLRLSTSHYSIVLYLKILVFLKIWIIYLKLVMICHNMLTVQTPSNCEHNDCFIKLINKLCCFSFYHTSQKPTLHFLYSIFNLPTAQHLFLLYTLFYLQELLREQEANYEVSTFIITYISQHSSNFDHQEKQ